MKRPAEVGRDFDDYVRRWRRENYQLEVGYAADGVKRDPSKSEEVQYPGDEWGDASALGKAYADIVARFLPGTAQLNVLEIGPGAGRSTIALLGQIEERVADYHVLDVSAEFMKLLQERVSFPLQVHVVDDVDLSPLPEARFEFCLAQSSWSHINVYDQYRFLRELRRVLRPGGILFVNGLFMLGGGHEWTWSRFTRRVSLIDKGANGAFHEFTSASALAEMLVRLGYEICYFFHSGFVARWSGADPESAELLSRPIVFPFRGGSDSFPAKAVTRDERSRPDVAVSKAAELGAKLSEA